MEREVLCSRRRLGGIGNELVWRSSLRRVLAAVSETVFIVCPLIMIVYILGRCFGNISAVISKVPALSQLIKLINIAFERTELPAVAVISAVGTLVLPILAAFAVRLVMSVTCTPQRGERKVSDDDVSALCDICDSLKRISCRAGIILSAVIFLMLIAAWILGALNERVLMGHVSRSVMLAFGGIVAGHVFILTPVVIFMSDIVSGAVFLMCRYPPKLERELRKRLEMNTENV